MAQTASFLGSTSFPSVVIFYGALEMQEVREHF
jgi:hypothetical protein